MNTLDNDHMNNIQSLRPLKLSPKSSSSMDNNDNFGYLNSNQDNNHAEYKKINKINVNCEKEFTHHYHQHHPQQQKQPLPSSSHDNKEEKEVEEEEQENFSSKNKIMNKIIDNINNIKIIPSHNNNLIHLNPKNVYGYKDERSHSASNIVHNNNNNHHHNNNDLITSYSHNFSIIPSYDRGSSGNGSAGGRIGEKRSNPLWDDRPILNYDNSHGLIMPVLQKDMSTPTLTTTTVTTTAGINPSSSYSSVHGHSLSIPNNSIMKDKGNEGKSSGNEGKSIVNESKNIGKSTKATTTSLMMNYTATSKVGIVNQSQLQKIKISRQMLEEENHQKEKKGLINDDDELNTKLRSLTNKSIISKVTHPINSTNTIIATSNFDNFLTHSTNLHVIPNIIKPSTQYKAYLNVSRRSTSSNIITNQQGNNIDYDITWENGKKVNEPLKNLLETANKPMENYIIDYIDDKNLHFKSVIDDKTTTEHQQRQQDQYRMLKTSHFSEEAKNTRYSDISQVFHERSITPKKITLESKPSYNNYSTEVPSMLKTASHNNPKSFTSSEISEQSDASIQQNYHKFSNSNQTQSSFLNDYPRISDTKFRLSLDSDTSVLRGDTDRLSNYLGGNLEKINNTPRTTTTTTTHELSKDTLAKYTSNQKPDLFTLGNPHDISNDDNILINAMIHLNGNNNNNNNNIDGYGYSNSNSINNNGNGLEQSQQQQQYQQSSLPYESNLDLIYELKGHENSINRMSIDNIKRILWSAGQDHKIILWSIIDGQLKQGDQKENDLIVDYGMKKLEPFKILWKYRKPALCLLNDSKNHLMFSGYSDGTIRSWNTHTYESSRIYKGHKGPVYDLYKHDLTNELISFSGDSCLKIWDIQHGQCKNIAIKHKSTITRICGTNAPNLIFTSSSDKSIIGWDLRSNSSIITFKEHKDSLTSLLYLSKDMKLISGSLDQTIRIWDFRATKSLNVIQVNQKINDLAYREKDNQIIVGGNQLMVIELDQGLDNHNNNSVIRMNDRIANPNHCRYYHHHHQGSIKTLQIDNNSDTLFTGSYDHIINVWKFKEPTFM